MKGFSVLCLLMVLVSCVGPVGGQSVGEVRKAVRVGVNFPGGKLANEVPSLATLKGHSDAHFDVLMKGGGGSRQLFDFYNRDQDVRWAVGSWTYPVDMTGVAWDDVQVKKGRETSTAEITMITPQHGIIAQHTIVRRGLSPTAKKGEVQVVKAGEAKAVVRFHDRSGRRYERRIAKYVNPDIWADITIVMLDKALPEAVTSYRLLSPVDRAGKKVDWMEFLANAKTLNTSRERECVIYNVKRIYGDSRAIVYGMEVPVAAEFRREPNRAIGGDSSNPSFIFVRGEPILIGYLTGGGSSGVFGSGPFFSSERYVPAFEKSVEQLGGKGKIGFVRLAR
ncbi:MAG: hypothetical protein ACSHYF_13875 [Verrucomicrobiaceae bacterium]